MGKADYEDRLSDYNTVPERIIEFKERHPEGSLRPLNPREPFQLVAVGGQSFVVYAASAYRTPDDRKPGVGVAWEPVPGKTPYTKDSELQNAETSAWGRAIVATLAADAKKGVATREDVQSRVDAEEAMAPTVAVRALVESIKGTEVAGPLKMWMAEYELSFTKPLTLTQFVNIADWVEEFSASPLADADDSPSSAAPVETGRPPIPDPSPGASPPTEANESKGTSASERGPQDANPAEASVGDTNGGGGAGAPVSGEDPTTAVLQLGLDLKALTGKARAEAMGEKSRLKITDLEHLDPDSEEYRLLRSKVTSLMGVSA